jgi:hypothetical protein
VFVVLKSVSFDNMFSKSSFFFFFFFLSFFFFFFFFFNFFKKNKKKEEEEFSDTLPNKPVVFVHRSNHYPSMS